MLLGAFLGTLISELTSLAKEQFKGKRLKKRIDETVHKASTDHSDIIQALCFDETFTKTLYFLARGQTIDAQGLVDLGVSVSKSKGIRLTRGKIIKDLKQFAHMLINIWEEIAPESGRIPNAFSNFNHSLDHLSTYGAQAPVEPGTETTYFIVPHRQNSLLRHQEDWIKQIGKQLADKGQAVISQSVALSGGGGVGKTAMAVEFSYRFAEDYPGGVFWLQMDHGLGLAARRFCELSARYGVNLGPLEDEAQLIQKVMTFLNNRPLKLVIFDNLEENTLPEDLTLKDMHLLVTTRRRGLALPVIEMRLPKEKEAEDIFLAYANRDLADLSPEEREAVVNICLRVDRLPLALEIMGQLARRQPLVSLAQKLAKEVVHLEAPTTTKELTSIRAALCLAKQEFQLPRTKEGLIAAGYLNPEGIEASTLADVLGVEDQEAGEILVELSDLSILEAGKQDYTIHRLTQEAIRLMDDDQAIGKKVAQHLDKFVKDASAKGVYSKAYHLIPHLVHLTSLAGEKLPWYEFPSERLVSSWARYLKQSGSYSQAETLYRACLSRVRNAMETKNPYYANVLNDLASVLGEQGKYDEAEQLFREALEVEERTIGKNHPHYGTALNNLGTILSEQGKYDGAEDIFREVLEIQEKTIGKNHRKYATTLRNLATVLWEQGKYAEAECIYREVIKIEEQAIGKNHPEYGATLNNLAALLCGQGKYREAEELCRKALEIEERTIGKKHPHSATILSNLGIALWEQGKYEEAEELYREVLDIKEDTIGKNHPHYATILSNLATVLSDQGKYGEAEDLFREALVIKELTIGKNHPDYGTTLGNLAGLLMDQGKYGEAEELYRKALVIEERTIGKDHPKYATILSNLAGVLKDQSKYGEAEKLYADVLEIDKRNIGKDHPHYATTLKNLAGVLTDQGKYEEAERFYRQALGISRRVLGPDHPQTRTIEANLRGLPTLRD